MGDPLHTQPTTEYWPMEMGQAQVLKAMHMHTVSRTNEQKLLLLSLPIKVINISNLSNAAEFLNFLVLYMRHSNLM